MKKQQNNRRKQLAALVLTLAMLLSATAWAGFADVPEDSDAFEAIEWARTTGLVGGTSEGLFEPNAPLTKAAFVTILWRMWDSPVVDTSSGSPDIWCTNGAWYENAANWGVFSGVLKSIDGIGAPLDGATFNEMMAAAGMNAASSSAVVTRGEAVSAMYASILASQSPNQE